MVYLKIILMVVLFIIMVTMIRAFLLEVYQYKIFGRYIVGKTSQSSSTRISKEEALRELYGAQEKTSFLYKIDLLLEQSGLKRYIPILNTELYLGLAVVLSVILFLFGTAAAAGNWIIGFGMALMGVVLLYGILEFLAGINFRHTEKSITQFANLIQSYSITSNDIIAIFGNIYIYLGEPLKSAVKSCFDEAHVTGDISTALVHLEKKINHPLFGMIIHNIEICSRHEANYSEIIVNIKKSLQDYMRNKEELKAMFDNGRAQIIMLIGLGVLILYILNGMVEENIYMLLTTTVIGQIILFVSFVVLFFCMLVFINFGAKKR